MGATLKYNDLGPYESYLTQIQRMSRLSANEALQIS